MNPDHLTGTALRRAHGRGPLDRGRA